VTYKRQEYLKLETKTSSQHRGECIPAGHSVSLYREGS